MSPREEYLMKEFETLKKEIENFTAELNSLIKHSMVFMTGIYSLLFYEKIDVKNDASLEFGGLVIWLSVILNILLFIRYAMVGFFIQEMSEYIQKQLEEKFLKEGEGWETNLNSKVRMVRFYKLMIMSIPNILYWIVVTLFTLFIALKFSK